MKIKCVLLLQALLLTRAKQLFARKSPSQKAAFLRCSSEEIIMEIPEFESVFKLDEREITTVIKKGQGIQVLV